MGRQTIEREIIQGIYKIENIKTNKVYIGQSIDIYKRWDDHKNMLEKNKHHSRKLQNSYNMTKDKNIFEYSILEVVENKEDLDSREKYYIDKYNSLYDGYNCADINNFINSKTIRKKINKIKQKYYYSIFYNLYDSDIIKFGSTWIWRIENEHYGWIPMSHVCIILKWFYDNYYNKDNTLKLGMTVVHGLIVARIIKDDEEVDAYRFKTINKKYVPEHNWNKDKPVTKEEFNKWIFDDSIEKELEKILEKKKNEYKNIIKK